MDCLEDDDSIDYALRIERRRSRRPTRRLRLVIAVQSRLVAEAFMFMLDSDPRVDAIGYSLDSWAALELVAAYEPDVVLVGEGLTGCDQVRFTELVHETFPDTLPILLRATLVPHEVEAAYAAGAAECLPTSCSADELLHAIQAAERRRIASARGRTAWALDERRPYPPARAHDRL